MAHRYQCTTCPFTTDDPLAAHGHWRAAPPRGWLGEHEPHPMTDAETPAGHAEAEAEEHWNDHGLCAACGAYLADNDQSLDVVDFDDWQTDDAVYFDPETGDYVDPNGCGHRSQWDHNQADYAAEPETLIRGDLPEHDAAVDAAMTATCHCPNHQNATGRYVLHTLGAPGCVAAPSVDVTPTWRAVVLGLAEAYGNGNTAARVELERMAELADRYVDVSRKARALAEEAERTLALGYSTGPSTEEWDAAYQTAEALRAVGLFPAGRPVDR